MKNYSQAVNTYVEKYKKQIVLIVPVAILILLVFAMWQVKALNSNPRVVYFPPKACDLFTGEEAKELLGGRVIQGANTDSIQKKNIATSQCSYSDANSNLDDMKVAAIAVRSGVNDEGVEQNKLDFATKMPKKDVEPVGNLGDSAYYNKKRGQLNVLKDRSWIILSIGVGATPDANTVEESVEFAHKVLP